MAKVLTDRFVESAKAEGGRTEIPDAKLQGLYLVVQTGGSKSWALRFRWQGKPAKFTLGRYPAIGLADAREKAGNALVELGNGIDPRAAKQERQEEKEREEARRQEESLEAVVDLFIRRWAKPRNKSWKETDRVLRRDVLPVWSDKRISEVTRRDVIKLIDGVVDRGSPLMANRVLAQVRKLFNWAVSRDMLEVSPCMGVKAPTPEPKRERVLTDVELMALWKAAEADGDIYGALVKLLVLTGQRREEVAQMRWSEIDLDAAAWTLSADRTKNSQPHIVPLSDDALSIIQARPKIAPGGEGGGRPVYVFTTTGLAPFSGFSKAKTRLDTAMANALNEDAADADDVIPLEPWRLHDIRRTVATGLQRLGVRLEVTEAVLNHVSGSRAGVVGVYQRYGWDDEKRAALDAWAKHVKALVIGEDRSNVVDIAEVVR